MPDTNAQEKDATLQQIEVVKHEIARQAAARVQLYYDSIHIPFSQKAEDDLVLYLEDKLTIRTQY